MNDYEIPRFSKNDIREFWSVLFEQKKELSDQLKREQDQTQQQCIQCQIDILQSTMNQLEQMFALF